MPNKNDTIVEMINKYSDMVYRIALTRCPNKETAEDVYQTVFLKYSEKMPEFKSEEHSKAWFIRVTINLSINENTSSWNKKTVELDDTISFENNCDLNIYNDIISLPENYKTVIYLMYYEGYKVKEIAEIMQTTEGTVKTWLYRAREALKLKIEEGMQDE